MKTTTTQKRAATGGQVGANGEDYKGGQFIATTDKAKKIRDKWTRQSSGQETVEFGWGAATRADIPAGMLPIVARLAGTFMGHDGSLNEEFIAISMERGHFGQAKLDQVREAARRFIAGERLLSVAEFPHLGVWTDVVRMLDAGQTIPPVLAEFFKATLDTIA